MEALELNKNVVVIYQPHQNIRQHEIQDGYADAFLGVKKVYWLPTVLAREDDSKILTPQDLISKMKNSEVAEVAEMNQELADAIKVHQVAGDLVIVMGAGSVDGWVRNNSNI